MARRPKEIVREEPPEEASAWSAVVLMASSVGAFALFSLFLAYNHPWTDALIARLPAPGPALSLAHDGIVAEQLRLEDVRTGHLTLADRSTALLFEATVVNDASLPVRGIVVEVEGFRDGRRVAVEHSACGKDVSERLVKRLGRDEVGALMRLDEVAWRTLAPGERRGCQVALTGLRTEVAEVSYRIASAEPTPDHPPTTPPAAE